ncbi:MAG: hypothetical protein L7U72_02675 [Rubripirellula sp.]|nr:hypothetical protein [Rubripirellula sp.]
MKRFAQLMIPVFLGISCSARPEVHAQGLSGVPQRLDETLGQQQVGNQPSGSSQPSSQQRRQGGPDPSSLPGYGGGSSAPPGSSGSGEQVRRGGGPGAALPGYGAGGSSSPPGGGQGMRGYPGGSSSPAGLGSPQAPGLGGSRGMGPSGSGGGRQGYDPGMESDPDMQMQGGYGDEYGYGGQGQGVGGPAGGGGMNPLGPAFASMFGSMDLSRLFFPSQDTNIQAGPRLRNEAEQAFQAGHYPMALELMFAHMATEYEDADVDLQNVKFSTLLKRPVWNVRWGVSISVRGDDVEDASPIKEGTRPAQGLAFGGGRGAGRGGFGGVGDFGGDYEESMGRDEFAGGDEQMDMQMDMQMQDEMGGFGGLGVPGAPGGRGGVSGATPATPSIPERKMLSDSAKQELNQYLGLVESVVADEFSKRFSQGDFGPLFTTVSAPVQIDLPQTNGFNTQAAPPAAAPSMSLELNDALLDAGDPLQPMWLPGISYLGAVDSSDSALEIAEDLQLDLILHFDVSLKQIREGLVQNVSRCRLLQVSPPADSQGRKRHLLITSKGMDNIESQQLAATDRMTEREYVGEQLNSLWNLIDRDIKVVDLPQLSAEVAKRRISSLLSGPSSRSLRTLAEVRYYQSMNLIDASDAEQLFHIAGDQDGLVLLYGPLDQRIEMSRKWAVEATKQEE